MKPVTATIDLNLEPTFLTLADIRKREKDGELWELQNDMITHADIRSCDHGFLSFGIEFKSKRQGVGHGIRSEGNVGMILLWLSRLLDCYAYEGDILKILTGNPVRVLRKFDPGGSMAECIYIGHFMEDRWIKWSDLVMAGIIAEG